MIPWRLAPRLLGAAALLAACNSAPPLLDGGTRDVYLYPDGASWTRDGGAIDGGRREASTDARPGDATRTDGTGSDGSIDSCSLPPLRLGPGYCVDTRVKLAGPVEALGLRAPYLFTLTKLPMTLALDRTRLLAGGALGAKDPIWATALSPQFTYRASPFLDVSGLETAALAYGTVQDPEGVQLDLASKATGSTQLFGRTAPDAFDAVWIADKTLLVLAKGVDTAKQGAAVYAVTHDPAAWLTSYTARRLITGLSQTHGSLAVGTDWVAVSELQPTTKQQRFWGFTLAEVKSALSQGKELALTADGDVILNEATSDAEGIGAQLAVTLTGSASSFAGVRTVDLRVIGDRIGVSVAMTSVVEPGGTATVKQLTSDGGKLGLYVVNGATHELAILRRK
ncbi:MAG: hypothetical protein IT371_10210 [Deltaproteobacteria bacterium]|nr:hypothetical protein [Deltaproteobacteria bacterium]